MLYGKPTKHIRVANESSFTVGPQRFYILPFWRYASNATSRTDGLDLEDSTSFPEGSIIKKHKLEILITPKTIEPQQLYIGRVKLSFSDVLHESHCGGHWTQASYGDTATEVFTAKTTPVATGLYPDDAEASKYRVQGYSTESEIGGSGSGDGIQQLMLDDHIKSVLHLKKVTVFDQRPLMGERWQKIPSKVKRINSGTFYGLFIFNDSVRGATPADTDVTVNVKSYIEEMAI